MVTSRSVVHLAPARKMSSWKPIPTSVFRVSQHPDGVGISVQEAGEASPVVLEKLPWRQLELEWDSVQLEADTPEGVRFKCTDESLLISLGAFTLRESPSF